MKIKLPITEMLGRGLAPTVNVRNNPMLTESKGAYPKDGVLRSQENYSRMQLPNLSYTFPYPQIFALSDMLLICTPTAIYDSTNLTTPLISGLTTGTTWDCIDFKQFVWLTNGQVSVVRQGGVWSISNDLPFGTCICNFNGQALIGSPDVATAGAI